LRCHVQPRCHDINNFTTLREFQTWDKDVYKNYERILLVPIFFGGKNVQTRLSLAAPFLKLLLPKHILPSTHSLIQNKTFSFSFMFSSSPSTDTVTACMYFLAGSVASSITFWFFRNSNSKMIELDNDDYSDEDEDVTPLISRHTRTATADSKLWGPQDAPYKMLLVVNTSLNMGKGKIAAQCGHAAVGAYKRASKLCPNAVRWWERTGCAKIAVKCPSEEELAAVLAAARSKDIPLYLVEDAGRTQIAAGSRTVLGLGPAPVHVFEGVTSHLKLM
jgi:peptidyl-tRNA hydrolase, PTH2 family